MAAIVPNALFVEVFTDDKIVYFRRLLDTKLAFEGGRVILPDRPGLGYDYLPDVVAKYAVDPWAYARSSSKISLTKSRDFHAGSGGV